MISLVIGALTAVLAGSNEPAHGWHRAGPQAALPIQDLQAAHIAANIPLAEDFEAFLVRDLTAHFSGRGFPARTVTYELLRPGPTQSGVAYPKYYVWVTATAGDGSVTEGVARVAAIERSRFEITDFVPREQIMSQPDSLNPVVPAALFVLTVERARRP